MNRRKRVLTCVRCNKEDDKKRVIQNVYFITIISAIIKAPYVKGYGKYDNTCKRTSDATFG